MVLRHGKALVFQQLFHFFRIDLGAWALVVIRRYRLAELLADEEQLALLLALRRLRVELAERGEAGAHDRDDEQHRDVGEAALQISRHRAIVDPRVLDLAARAAHQAYAAGGMACLPAAAEPGIGDQAALAQLSIAHSLSRRSSRPRRCPCVCPAAAPPPRSK